jgi:hypothetical protein
MSQVKRQHYVPRFYLERFSRSGRLFAYDRTEGRKFQCSVGKVASIRYFYDIPSSVLDACEDTQRFEKQLSSIEGECAGILGAMASSSVATTSWPLACQVGGRPT